MSTIPLPALNVHPPEAPDAMGSMAKVMQMRDLMQRGQMNQQDIQIRDQQIKDSQAMTAAMKDWDGKDYDALSKSVLQNGGSANAAASIQQHGLTIKKTISDIASTDATTGSKDLETFIGKHKAVGDTLEAGKDVPDDQLHQWALGAIDQLAKGGILEPQQAQQFAQGVQSVQDPKALRLQIDQFAKTQQGIKATAEQELAGYTARKTKTEAELGEIKVNLSKNSKPGDFDAVIDQMAPPKGDNAALNYRTKGMVNFALQRGDIESAQKALDAASSQLGSIEKETNPAVQAAKLHLATATKAAEQAISDGDPKAAAQLLVDGTVAPSQLISSRKPAFAQQAFTAAAQMKPGWSATKADADYKVASSPTQVAFFGSAKSLTDKGGTLDQLAAAGKDIPANQFPVFNTVADAIKASTGSGPIAKYAALALGVADDYSKVMGGGQGSDTSRTQAMQIIGAKQSPEQRASSIEGIRGAVGSQTKSRIGNNAVLQKMYGEDLPAASPASGTDPFAKFGGKARGN